MKKVLIIFYLLILIFFLKVSPIFASCTTLTFPNTTCLTPGTSPCTNTSGRNFCCTGNGIVLGTTECQVLIGPPASTAPVSGNPANGSTTSVTCGSGNTIGISTAIGCIHFGTTTAFASDILKWAVGIGGGIAFLLALYAGFMIMTSAGNPERLKAGQELLTSAIGGLLLLIFSIFILKIIGVDILGLGAFGFGFAQ